MPLALPRPVSDVPAVRVHSGTRLAYWRVVRDRTTMTTLTTTSYRLQGVDLQVRRKGAGPRMLVLHGGGGPVVSYPFADRLAERFELIEPVHPGFAGTPIPDHFDGLED